mmetsp:Transcript_29734/g.84807  ORF Transcript_29734/g.84807 Transcript_29734/m.84807 type:complete len:378 (-) Transcript_29734:231-1364(-)
MGPAAVAVVSRLVSLALCSSLTKLQLSTESIRLDGSLEAFRRPMFMSLTMQMALLCSGCLGMLAGRRMRELPGKSPDPLKCLEEAATTAGSDASTKTALSWSTVWRIGVLSAISMAGGVVGSQALVFLPVSMWQLSQASGILFTALMAKAFLAQRLGLARRVGIALCITGVTLAGLSDALDAPTGVAEAVLGMALALISQALGAAAAVAEEHLLKAAAVPPMQLIALEGAWGVGMTLFVVYPAMHLLPGHAEGLLDSMVMLLNNPALFAIQAVLLLAMMGSSVSGIALTAVLSSVHRKMLNVSVGAIVWTSALIVHYCVDKASLFGEPWSDDSLLELAGFVLIGAGQAVYGGLLRCGCLQCGGEEARGSEAALEAGR